jgi:nickel-dependent lactate racemase
MNKGIGAGGAKTNYYGKRFEEKTNNEMRLLENDYTKNNITHKIKNIYDYYLSKTFENKTIIFLLQNGLKTYMKNK